MKLDSRSTIHLKWMFENQPDLVRELSQSSKLEEPLEQKLQAALTLVLDLKVKQGLSEHEAFDVATELILAPPDGPAFQENPPGPLPLKEREAAYRRFEAKEIARQRLQAVGSRIEPE